MKLQTSKRMSIFGLSLLATWLLLSACIAPASSLPVVTVFKSPT